MPKNNLKEKHMEKPIENHDTAAWNDFEKRVPVSKVGITSELGVRNAKEWVDTNQK